MSKDQMGYQDLVDSALRGVVRTVLDRVAESGLPGAHHLYISFRTDFAGVLVPDQLRRKYPEEMTIVLQHQFWGLSTSDEGFEVTLSFGGAHELLSIPFAALTGFVDPSVRFGLQFKAGPEIANEASVATAAPAPIARAQASGSGATPPAEAPSETKGEKVVTLDAFRKK